MLGLLLTHDALHRAHPKQQTRTTTTNKRKAISTQEQTATTSTTQPPRGSARWRTTRRSLTSGSAVDGRRKTSHEKGLFTTQRHPGSEPAPPCPVQRHSRPSRQKLWREDEDSSKRLSPQDCLLGRRASGVLEKLRLTLKSPLL